MGLLPWLVVGLCLVTVVPRTLGQGCDVTGTTVGLQGIFIGRCLNHPSAPTDNITTVCEEAWRLFSNVTAFRDPEDVQVEDYMPLSRCVYVPFWCHPQPRPSVVENRTPDLISASPPSPRR